MTRARRIWLLAALVLLAAALLVAEHTYLIVRLVLEPGLGEPWRSLLTGSIALLGVSLVAQPVVERAWPPARARLVSWPAALWMGVGFLLTVQLMASDAVLWLLAAGAATAADGEGRTGPAGLRAAGVACVTLVAAAVALRSGLSEPAHRRVELALPRWPRGLDGFRIVQISDLHIGPLLGRRFAEKVVARVAELAPDLVAITGDLVDGSVRRIGDEVAPFAELRAPHGVFFVTGNHDHYSGADAWVRRVAELGIRVLRNERVAISTDAGCFDLVGVDDHRGDLLSTRGGEDLDRALAGRARERPAVLLAHDPTTFRRAARLGIDLQLSGHTHGGQIWPFRYLVRLAVPFVAGCYRRADAQLYVSCGTGFWGPPMRLGAPAEITELVLRSGGGAA